MKLPIFLSAFVGSAEIPESLYSVIGDAKLRLTNSGVRVICDPNRVIRKPLMDAVVVEEATPVSFDRMAYQPAHFSSSDAGLIGIRAARLKCDDLSFRS